MPHGVIREVPGEVRWEVDLPALQTDWDYWSPEFTSREIKCKFNLEPGGSASHVVVRFMIRAPDTADFSRLLRWHMAVVGNVGSGLQCIMNGGRTVNGGYCGDAQQVAIKRAELERLPSPGSPLTFILRIKVEEVYTQIEDHFGAFNLLGLPWRVLSRYTSMDWQGRVGEIRVVFRSKWDVVFDWAIPNFFSMPRRVNNVYYSAELKFLDVTWYLGVYQNDAQEWIGLEIWRSDTCYGKHVSFSIGLKEKNGVQEVMHCEQRYPDKSLSYNVDKFMLISDLWRCKAQLAPSDVLTVACALWRDVTSPENCALPGFSGPMTVNMVSGSSTKEHVDEKGKTQVSRETHAKSESVVAAVEKESHNVDVKGMPDGVAREVSKGVYWEVDLPPQQRHWDYWSPDFTLGKINYRFNLYPGGFYSDGVYLRFVIKVPDTAVFPLHLRWQMGAKMGDAAGFRWLMNGETVVEEKCHKHVQQVRVLRAELQRLLSPDARLTFFHHLDVGIQITNSQVSTQTEEQCLDKTQVSQMEQESAASTKERHSNLDPKEFEELRQHFQLWLKHPEEGDRIRRLRLEKFEANHGKTIWKLPEKENEPLIFAA